MGLLNILNSKMYYYEHLYPANIMKQTIQLIEAAHFDFNAITLNILGSTPTFNGIKI